MLRQALLAASRSDRAERVVSASPLTGTMVRRYVADDVGAAVTELTRRGLLVTVGSLVAEAGDRAEAEGNVLAHQRLVESLPPDADVSVDLTALGLRLSEQLALDNAATLCESAAERGVTLTLDASGPGAATGLHSIHATLRKEHPAVGVVVRAGEPGSAERCARLDGARVRLVKGPRTAPAEVDRAFARCLRVLMSGAGYPMIATHDPRLLRVTAALAVLEGLEPAGFEYQMLYGVRPDEQRRLAGQGARVRVHVPYGAGWYPYLMRRLAERPAFFARTLLSRR
ncbi:proline dehydrogenase family protein [Nonomuraea sp. NPDC003214]